MLKEGASVHIQCVQCDWHLTIAGCAALAVERAAAVALRDHLWIAHEGERPQG